MGVQSEEPAILPAAAHTEAHIAVTVDTWLDVSEGARGLEAGVLLAWSPE